ncbi:MAG: hypothetical protein ACOC5M_01395 [Chloroflexota bacterium]
MAFNVRFNRPGGQMSPVKRGVLYGAFAGIALVAVALIIVGLIVGVVMAIVAAIAGAAVGFGFGLVAQLVSLIRGDRRGPPYKIE